MSAQASAPLTPSRAGAWALLGIPTPAAALYAALALMPFLAVTVGAKTLKYLALGDGVWLPDWLAVTGGDIAFGLALVVVFALLSCARARAVRFLAVACLHAVAPLLAAAAVFEHGFFSVTGAVVDAHIVVEYGMQLKQVKKVIASEIDAVRGISLLLPFGYSLALLLAAKTGAVTRLIARLTPLALWRRRAPAVVVAAAVLAAAAGLSSQWRALPSGLHPIADNFVVGLTRDLLSLARRPTGEGLVPDVEPVAPVEWKLAARPRAKNLVTIVLESVGAKRTTVHDPSLPTTPFLASLAARGAVVEHGYTVVPHTTKALISIHCGVYPKLDPRVDEASAAGIPEECLADVLKKQGFATAYFQAAEENYERRQDLVHQFGFEGFVGKESLAGKGFDESNYFGWEDDVLVRPVLEWVDGHRDRFYLSVLTLVSHHPYNVPAGFEARRFAKDRALNDYLNTVAYTDRFLEKLFAGFEERGLMDDTLFVIVGDHGEAFREHGRYQHDSILHEEGVHVPFVLVGAGIEPGARVEGPRQLVDVLPTALAHLGFVPDRHPLGRDVLGEPAHEQLFMSCHFKGYCMALRKGERKYIYNYRKRAPEVYDLDVDPLEQQNLHDGLDDGERGALHDETARAIAEMQRIHDRTMAEYNAQRGSVVAAFVKRADPRIGTPLALDFDGVVRLLSWQLDPPVIVAGKKSVVTLVYQVLGDVPLGWQPFMHVRGPQSINADHVPVEGAYPMREWRQGDFVIDRHTLTTRPLFAPGDYAIVTGIGGAGRVVPTGEGADVRDNGDVHLGVLQVIKPPLAVDEHVTTTPPPEPPDRDVVFGGAVRLRTVVVDRPRVKGGLKTTFTFAWEVLEAPGADWQLEVAIEGPANKPRARHLPLNGGYPTSRWQKGEYVSDPFEIVTHTADRRAPYRVKARFLDEGGRPVPALDGGEASADGFVDVGGYTVIAD